ncbi:MAG TPA: glycerophosphodiester phosphodiesterase [Usitatibacter sp.]|jgi:glycerophosphoryl diester phosphodiesterase|nr:glycerophosphodiester phosphodiesterase [Usitatibacter sp.]
MSRDWPFPRIIAHRGGGSLAPENTLAAIRAGQSMGYTGQEFDVKLSLDDRSLLLHDTTLERTTNGAGRAADMTFEALRALDAGSWHSAEYRGEPIPSFAEVAQQLLAKGTAADIEIKPTPGFDWRTGTRVALEAQQLWSGSASKPLFTSFSFEALMAAKEAAPDIPRGWLIPRFTDADWKRLEDLEAVALVTDHRRFPVSEIERVKTAGYRVMVYTINDADVAQQYLDAGIDALVTDNLREFAQSFPALI